MTQWDVFEIVLAGPDEIALAQAGTNPFDVDLFGSFTSTAAGPAATRVRGFYDGAGTWKIRFMPGVTGAWSYTTSCSGVAALDKQSGSFTAIPSPTIGASPVRVRDTRLFEHADGSQHFSVGTTSYAWIHQNDTLVANTVATLADATTPFNKMRMTVSV